MEASRKQGKGFFSILRHGPRDFGDALSVNRGHAFANTLKSWHMLFLFDCNRNFFASVLL